MTDDLFLVVTINGERVALPSRQVESVVELTQVTPIPRVSPHIAGLSSLRSRVITVIDTRTALGLPEAPSGALTVAVVVVIDGHSYGLVADSVEDVAGGRIEPLSVSDRVAANWRRVATAMVEIDGALMLLIDAEALVAAPVSSPARAA